MRHRSGYCNVRPRYTPGSPGMVDEDQARRVAEQEKQGFENERDYGTDKQQRRARALGLRGIAEIAWEDKNGWNVWDLCTDERYFRPVLQLSIKQRKKPPFGFVVRESEGGFVVHRLWRASLGKKSELVPEYGFFEVRADAERKVASLHDAMAIDRGVEDALKYRGTLD